MAAIRSTLSREGRALLPLELVPLKSGTPLPAAVYQALADVYVEMMRRKGVLTAEGEIDASALLDTTSIRETQFASRSESAVAPRPGPRVQAEPGSEPPLSRFGFRPL